MVETSIQNLKSELFKARPVLGEIIEYQGNKSLYDYVNESLVGVFPVEIDRKNELIETVKDEVEKLLGKDMANAAAEDLANHYFISTADHHGPLNHQFFLHSDLLLSLAKKESRSASIFFACSNVSLGNSSYPRGLTFHVPKGDKAPLIKFPFFLASERMKPVLYQDPFNREHINTLESLLKKELKDVSNRKKNVEDIINIYRDERVLSQHSYSEQITTSNFLLWQKFLPSLHLPPLVYLTQEDIVTQLILRYHLDKDTVIHSFLFGTDILNEVEKSFDGVPGAFSKKDEKGTFLFWKYSKDDGKRIALTYENGKLVAKKGDWSLSLEPEALRSALINKEIIPSVLVTSVVLSCYYGLTCAGGFSQTTYLTLISDKYRQIFPREVQRVNTKMLGADYIFANVLYKDYAYAATGLDLILFADDGTSQRFVDLTKSLTVRSTIESIIFHLHKMLYGEKILAPSQGKYYDSEFSLLSNYAETIATVQ